MAKATTKKSITVKYNRRIEHSTDRWEVFREAKVFTSDTEADQFVKDCAAGKFNKGNEKFGSARIAA